MDADRILTSLNNAGITQKQPALYQAIKFLINASRNNQDAITIVTGGGGGGGLVGASYLTINYETGLPNSRQLLAGTDISFDDSVPHLRTINLVLTGTFDKDILFNNSGALGGIPVGDDGQYLISNGVSSTASFREGLRSIAVPLTDAQIKALPTSTLTGGFEIIPTPGSGFRIKVISATLILNRDAGVYTNIDSSYSTLQLQTPNGDWLSNIVLNDNTAVPALTKLTDMFNSGGSTHPVVDLMVPYSDVSNNGWISPTVTTDFTSVDDAPVNLGFDNNGTGDLMGGDAANSLIVIVNYMIQSLS